MSISNASAQSQIGHEQDLFGNESSRRFEEKLIHKRQCSCRLSVMGVSKISEQARTTDLGFQPSAEWSQFDRLLAEDRQETSEYTSELRRHFFFAALALFENIRLIWSSENRNLT
jgi:hypothetical protein